MGPPYRRDKPLTKRIIMMTHCRYVAWAIGHFLLSVLICQSLNESVNTDHHHAIKMFTTWMGVWRRVKSSDVSVAAVFSTNGRRRNAKRRRGIRLFMCFPAVCVTSCLTDGSQLAMDTYISCQRLWQRGSGWFGLDTGSRLEAYLLLFCFRFKETAPVCEFKQLSGR